MIVCDEAKNASQKGMACMDDSEDTPSEKAPLQVMPIPRKLTS